MKRLYLVFNTIKLTTAFKNPISSRYLNPSLDTIIIDKQEKYEVEKILVSY